MDSQDDETTRLEAWFGGWLTERAAGSDPDLEELCRAHPEHSGRLREMKQAYELLLAGAPSGGGDAPPAGQRARLEPTWGEGHDQETSLALPPSGSPAGLVRSLERRGFPRTRYEVEGELARGGMGAILRVWDHDLRRRLAMKVILDRDVAEAPPGATASEAARLARFLEEAQLTGQLDHPGIVPVHELGIGDDGHVFFTMKLVEGRDLKEVFELVRDGRDGWTEVKALGVLRKVCEAMSYAHAKGVIHRDLKPANVMVGSFGEVYVMDWGLAKVRAGAESQDVRARLAGTLPDPEAPRAASTRCGGAFGVTQEGDVVGTPAYMPPEQAAGDLAAVGAHSDVYSVGAMLYHLLVRHAPYADTRAEGTDPEVLRRVQAGPPPPLAEEAPAAAPELVAICERAMAREIGARYPDMGELAADLSAFLEGEVVAAYETGTWAETKKWVRRNRALATSLAAALLLLAGGLSASLVYKARAEENARVADERRVDAEAARTEALAGQEAAQRSAEETRLIAEFQSQMLSGISIDELGLTIVAELERDLEQNLARKGADEAKIARARAALREALSEGNPTNVAQRVLEKAIFEPAEHTIDARYVDRPLLAAMLRSPLANTLRELSLFGLGERMARAAVDARRAGLGNAHPETLIAITRLGVLLKAESKLAEAEPLLREATAGLRAALGERHPETLQATNNLANLLHVRGRHGESEALHREALAGYRALAGDDDPETLKSQSNLAVVVQAQGRLAEAEPLLRSVLAGRRAKLGDEHPDTLLSLNTLAALLERRGARSEAESLFRQALAGRRARLGDAHLDTLRTVANLGLLLLGKGEFAEAESLLREALDGRRAKLDELHPEVLTSLDGLAQLFLKQNKLEDAEPLFRDVHSAYLTSLGEGHPNTLSSANNLACVLQKQGRSSEAESLFRQALAGSRAALGDRHPETVSVLSNLAFAVHAQGRLADAEALWREALASPLARLADLHPQAVHAAEPLAAVLVAQARFAEAAPLLEELLAASRSKLGDADAATRRIARQLVAVYERWQAAEDEAEHGARALELRATFGL